MASITFLATNNHNTPELVEKGGIYGRKSITQTDVAVNLFNRNFYRNSENPNKTAPKPEILRNCVGEYEKHVKPNYSNGFVGSLLDAYNYHLNIVIKPDHVWMAILSQFSFYVQKNAEQLRDKFVSHEGKKELTVRQAADIDTANFKKASLDFINIMKKHLKDATVAEWLIPSFTTTKLHDKVCFSIVMMGTMKKYFSYRVELSCGIPNVTLLGTVEDWQKLRKLVDKLLDYDLEDKSMKKWYNMLVPILDNFVQSRQGEGKVEWWDKVCSHKGGGSGPSYLSGWITAFCVFSDGDDDDVGKWQGSCTKRNVCYFDTEIVDNTPWPIINTNDIPSAVVTVPVIVDDNGMVEYKTEMFAGCVSEGIVNDRTITPENGWCMFIKSKKNL